MTDTQSTDDEEESPRIETVEVTVLEANETPDLDAPALEPSTVGTGSYVAVSCSVMMILLTLVLLIGLFIARWLT